MTTAAAVTVGLRPYQEECLDRLVEAKRGGDQVRALVALPTGTGKTVIFAQLPALAKRRVLIMAHREELLEQAALQIAAANPGVAVGFEQADRKPAASDKVVVASVQSLVNRLAGYDPEEFSIVVVDEAHHAVARSYVEVLAHFGLAPRVSDLGRRELERKQVTKEVRARFADFSPRPGAPFLVGFTATPGRTDGIGLGSIFDRIVFQGTIAGMIEDGWLVPIHGKRIGTGLDITGVKRALGDFQVGSLADAVDIPHRNELAVKAYKDHGEGKHALIFCVNVAHTENMAGTFRGAGIPAAAVYGDMGRSERRQTLAAYKSGEIKVLCNCMVLTEGYDAPYVEIILMARPTESSLMYTQMLGRGTRLAPEIGKSRLLVLDLVDVSQKAAVQSLNTLFGLPPRLDLNGAGAIETERDIRHRVQGVLPMEWLADVEDIDQIETVVTSFNPLKVSHTDPRLKGSPYAWIPVSNGFALSIPSAGMIGLVEDLVGNWQVQVQQQGKIETLAEHLPSLEDALEEGDLWVEENLCIDEEPLVNKRAKWHALPATDKQISLLRQMGIAVPEGLARGHASALISQKIGQRKW